MRSNLLFCVSVLALAACSGTQESKPESGEVPIERVSTDLAVRAPGDVVPLSLRATVLPVRDGDATISGSDPLPVKQVFTLGRMPTRIAGKEFRRVLDAGMSKDAATIPIDAPSGARVVVFSSASPTTQMDVFRNVHLRHVATDKVLDLSRDTLPTGGKLLDLHPPPKADADSGKFLTPGAAPLSPGLPSLTPGPALTTPVIGGFDEIARLAPETGLFQAPNRTFSIDVPTVPGFVAVETNEVFKSSPAIIDVQQPSSTIELGATRASDLVSFGEQAEVVFDLADQSTPLDGAKFLGHVRTPGGDRYGNLEVVALGGGKYSTKVPVVSADPKHVGVWSIHVKATGATADGRPYERDLDVPFSYTVPFAKMTHVTTPKIVRGKGDMVTEIAVDVDVESVQDARLGLSAVLVVRDADGKEHPVAIAQTGQDIKPGTSVMTLHFRADALVVANASGRMFLRELSLISHGNAATLHRLARGMDLGSSALKAGELKPIGAPKAAVQEALDLGSL